MAPHVPTQLAPLTSADISALLFQNLMDRSQERVFFKDRDSRFLQVSSGEASYLGLRTTAAAIGLSDRHLLPDSEHAAAAAAVEADIIRTGEPHVGFLEHVNPPGGERSWNIASKYPLLAPDGSIIGTFGFSHDVTARVRAEEDSRHYAAEVLAANVELRRTEQELRALLDNSPDAIVKIDGDLRYVYANEKAIDVFGGAPIGGDVDRGPEHEVWRAAIRRVLETGVAAEHDLVLDRDGVPTYLHARLVPILDQSAAVTHVLIASRDMTDRAVAEEALAHQAMHDALTDLPNRVLLLDRLQTALNRLERSGGLVTVLFLDIDRFKVVNDSLGHGVGDQLLSAVAARLADACGPGDTLARFGGDEFVLVAEGMFTENDVRELSSRIAHAFTAPFALADQNITVSASIGIATAADSTLSPADVVRDADAAMYLAKDRGRGRAEFFDASVHHRAQQRLAIETGLRHAIEHDELRLVYQPVVRLADRTIVGMEALVRWDHPERGEVAPIDFIPVAEDSRLIVSLDRWVLAAACRQLAEWNARRPGRPLTMAVNISARQLTEPDVVETVAAILQRHAIPPELLCLEVTETAMLRDGDATERVLAGLTAMGVKIALDDFGTGYSSLGHLQRFAVDIVKIDRSFVARMDTDSNGAAIVAAVTGMATALGMITVGEGIETVEQLDQLTALGCDDGQGYLLARPTKPALLEDSLDLDAL